MTVDLTARDVIPVPVTLMRGGTSKGVFLRLDALPPPGPMRDRFVLALLGSPDPMQLDGLGGTHSSTSKLVAVANAEQARCLGYQVDDSVDLVYLFAQVAVADATVDWSGNCGNLTAAVAPFALHEGLIAAADPVAVVELLNLNTARRITVTVPVRAGCPAVDGDFAVPGVPGTGARIEVRYHDPGGSVTGRLFPTGLRRESLEIDGHGYPVTLLDVSSPVVALRAEDVGLTGYESPGELNTRPDVLRLLEAVRSAAAVRLGFAPDTASVPVASPALPRLMTIAGPGEPASQATDCDVVARMTSMGAVHHAFPGTGLAAAAVLVLTPGTVAGGIDTLVPGEVRLAHPKGVVTVGAEIHDAAGDPRVAWASVPRTARRLMSGTAYVRASSLGPPRPA